MDLQDADVKPRTRSAFDELCEKYPTIFSKGNEDIGRTQLITMDIDTGNSPPVSSRPYTLALKHHQWVQDEIETLERAGVITKSMSPWASPIVVVPTCTLSAHSAGKTVSVATTGQVVFQSTA